MMKILSLHHVHILFQFICCVMYDKQLLYCNKDIDFAYQLNVKHSKLVLVVFQCRNYSEITVETGTQLKSVIFTTDIFAVFKRREPD